MNIGMIVKFLRKYLCHCNWHNAVVLVYLLGIM